MAKWEFPQRQEQQKRQQSSNNTCRAANAIAFHKSRNNNRKITSGVTRTKRGSKKGVSHAWIVGDRGMMRLRMRTGGLRGYGGVACQRIWNGCIDGRHYYPMMYAHVSVHLWHWKCSRWPQLVTEWWLHEEQLKFGDPGSCTTYISSLSA